MGGRPGGLVETGRTVGGCASGTGYGILLSLLLYLLCQFEDQDTKYNIVNTLHEHIHTLNINIITVSIKSVTVISMAHIEETTVDVYFTRSDLSMS